MVTNYARRYVEDFVTLNEVTNLTQENWNNERRRQMTKKTKQKCHAWDIVLATPVMTIKSANWSLLKWKVAFK